MLEQIARDRAGPLRRPRQARVSMRKGWPLENVAWMSLGAFGESSGDCRARCGAGRSQPRARSAGTGGDCPFRHPVSLVPSDRLDANTAAAIAVVSQGSTGALRPGQAPGDVRPHAEDQCRLRHLGQADVRRGMEKALRQATLRTERSPWQYRHGERTEAGSRNSWHC